MEPKHILIIEDGKAVQIKMKMDLEEVGYRISLADNGLSALDYLEQGDLPDLITLDLIMPKISGLDFLIRLKTREEWRDIPVIIVSTINLKEELVKALSMGANDYLSKPFDNSELLARIRTQLRITDLISKQKKLIHELKQLDEVKNHFLGMAVHDLKNPLGIISSYLELLFEPDLEENDRDSFLEQIKSMIYKMNNIIINLLDINKIESGNLLLCMESIEPVHLLKNVQMETKTLLNAKNIKIILDIEDNLPIINIDSERIKDVFMNLLSNAVKYSNPFTSITVSAKLTDNFIEFSVKDQGQGIPENEIKSLFKPFAKLSVKPTAGEVSTGLGLVIVKKVIELHGGKIWVNTVFHKGSEFIFTIPCNFKS